MLDAHPAPDARPRVAPAVPVSPIAEPATPQPASAPAALLAAARTLLPVLEAGKALDARTLREAMTSAFGASDADGAWLWKDSYEAAEAALVLFLQRYGRAMRREAGAGAGGPAAMLRMLETLAALEPSQTRRSEEQLKYQQFSTPLPLAYAALAGGHDPARRRRARTVGGHRDAGRHGAACARQRGRRRAAPQRDRRRPRGPPRRPLPGQHRHPPQRGVDQGPAAGAAGPPWC